MEAAGAETGTESEETGMETGTEGDIVRRGGTTTETGQCMEEEVR